MGFLSTLERNWEYVRKKYEQLTLSWQKKLLLALQSRISFQRFHETRKDERECNSDSRPTSVGKLVQLRGPAINWRRGTARSNVRSREINRCVHVKQGTLGGQNALAPHCAAGNVWRARAKACIATAHYYWCRSQMLGAITSSLQRLNTLHVSPSHFHT